jgi:DNA-binding NarL/FixJ family response regulator
VSQRVHVLLVDDDPLSVFNTKRALHRSPDVAGVTVATDGRDAFDQLRRGVPTSERLVVLTDLGMPRMSGLQLIAAIRAEPSLSELMVVILTTSANDHDRAAAHALQVAGYFVKSSQPGNLDAVRACLCA